MRFKKKFHIVVTVRNIPLPYYCPRWEQVFEEGHREYTLDNALLYWAICRAIRKGRLNRRGVWGAEVTRWGIFWFKSRVVPVD